MEKVKAGALIVKVELWDWLKDTKYNRVVFLEDEFIDDYCVLSSGRSNYEALRRAVIKLEELLSSVTDMLEEERKNHKPAHKKSNRFA